MSGTSLDIRTKTILTYAAFLLMLIVNASLCYYCWYFQKDFTSATLYALNGMAAVLLLCTLAIQARIVDDENPKKRAKTPFLYSTVGTMIGCVLLISIVKTLSPDISISRPMIFFSFLSATSILIIYIYIIILRDHS